MTALVESEQPKDRQNPTFVVRILRHQNSTWQGSVQWVEGSQTQHFRSLLELIRLMDGVTSPTESA